MPVGIDLFGSTDQSTQSTQQTDNSQALSATQQTGGDLLQLSPTITQGGSGTLNLQVSDYGAVAGSQAILGSGLADLLHTANRQSSAAADAVRGALDLAGRTTETGAQTAGGTLVSLAKWGALALAAALFARWVFGFFKKKG